MREHDFIKIINKTLSDNSFLGDDCAFLKEFGVFVTHDTMVEDVHFSLEYSIPFQIGYKAVVSNLSDLAASLAEPLYLTVSLSLPNNISDDFVKNLYEGINSACEKYCVRVVGGDITGSEKIIVSICAIGKKQCEYFSGRNNAKVGDVIVVTGDHGSSAAGLKCFKKNINNPILKEQHLMPEPRFDAVTEILKCISSDIACMDTSDGLYDALNQVARASNVTAHVDFSLVPYDRRIEIFEDFKNLILFGGEDYELLLTMRKELYEKLDKNKFFKIGTIVEKVSKPVIIENLNSDITQERIFDHFGSH